METFSKRAGTIDQTAVQLTLRCVRGDSFTIGVDVVTDHPAEYAPGKVLTVPVAVVDLSWNSLISDQNGSPIGTFTILDDPLKGNRLTLNLSATETAAMTAGTYEYWVDAVNVVTGTQRTWLAGAFEVAEKL